MRRPAEPTTEEENRLILDRLPAATERQLNAKHPMVQNAVLYSTALDRTRYGATDAAQAVRCVCAACVLRFHRSGDRGNIVHEDSSAGDRDEIHASRAMAVMRRLVVLSTIVVLALVASPSIADASVNSRVNGSVTGEAPFDFGTRCSFVHQRIIATVDITRGPTASLKLDTCVDLSGNGFVATGTFTFRAPSGILSGTVNGTATSDLAPRFDYTLVVLHGTRGFKHASGKLRFTGVWHSNQVDGGPVTGRLRASLTHCHA